MNIRSKIVPMRLLGEWRQRQKAKIVVVTNGCFDLLHAGHITFLEKAKAFGGVLLVGLNGDISVRKLKGPNRPWYGSKYRAIMLAGLQSVDAVCVFPQVRATTFLRIASPDIYIKGRGYRLGNLWPAEFKVLMDCGSHISFVDSGIDASTSKTLKKLLS